MQRYSSDGVRQERTDWRDERISHRHREWGFDCPAVDVDFLMVEYDRGLPVGIVDYKHYKAREPVLDGPSYRAIKALADGYRPGPLFFIVAFYWPDIWSFQTLLVNEAAKTDFEHRKLMTEREFVSRLYRARRRVTVGQVASILCDELPPETMRR
jgi:hypothetical protein